MDFEKVEQGLLEALAHMRGELKLTSEVISVASQEGWKAGMNLDDVCPYASGTAEHRDWSEGYRLALRTHGSA